MNVERGIMALFKKGTSGFKFLTVENFLNAVRNLVIFGTIKLPNKRASENYINAFIENAKNMELEMFAPGAQYWQIYNQN